MANHKSAIKRHKQSRKRAERNRAARTRAKNVVKAVRVALLEKNPEKAAGALTTATSILDKTAGKGIIHWKNAARKISRLTRAVNAARAEHQ
ncbi:MAG: 30S ribosomal protein S20 [Desulfovibrio sp.]|nr:30S ribosomal protein S20 [Desulfovibrio sp.]